MENEGAEFGMRNAGEIENGEWGAGRSQDIGLTDSGFWRWGRQTDSATLEVARCEHPGVVLEYRCGNLN